MGNPESFVMGWRPLSGLIRRTGSLTAFQPFIKVEEVVASGRGSWQLRASKEARDRNLGWAGEPSSPFWRIQAKSRGSKSDGSTGIALNPTVMPDA